MPKLSDQTFVVNPTVDSLAPALQQSDEHIKSAQTLHKECRKWAKRAKASMPYFRGDFDIDELASRPKNSLKEIERLKVLIKDSIAHQEAQATTGAWIDKHNRLAAVVLSDRILPQHPPANPPPKPDAPPLPRPITPQKQRDPSDLHEYIPSTADIVSQFHLCFPSYLSPIQTLICVYQHPIYEQYKNRGVADVNTARANGQSIVRDGFSVRSLGPSVSSL